LVGARVFLRIMGSERRGKDGWMDGWIGTSVKK